MVDGWVNAYGPAFESKRDDVPLRVLKTAADHGFRETYPPEEVKARWKSSWGRWQSLRREANQSSRDDRGPGIREGMAAPPAPVEPGGS